MSNDTFGINSFIIVYLLLGGLIMLLPGKRYGLGGLMQDLNRMNRAFNSMLESTSGSGGRNYPAINVWDADEKIIITSELPGITAEQIDLSITGRELTLSAKIDNSEGSEKEQNYLCREIVRKSFSRTIELPCSVDSEQIDARIEKGILAIQLRKQESARAKKITIQAS